MAGEQRVSVPIFPVGDGNEERFCCEEIFAFIRFCVPILKIVLAFLSRFLFAALSFFAATHQHRWQQNRRDDRQ